MRRKAALIALCGFAFLPLAQAQKRTVDAAFAAAPFQQWVTQGPKAELPWHPRISPPALSLHQRIAVRVEVELDGKELVARCCEGQAIALVQISDQQGRSYRNYCVQELKDVAPGLTQYMVNLSWQVFLLPGEYNATVAFYYSGRNAHSLTSEHLHVPALKHDPLPDSWRDLPGVEFADPQPQGLDAFLLPNIGGRLRLPAKSKKPIHVEILENLTAYPSERRHTKLYTDRLGLFLPLLKTFTQLEIENGTLSLSLLDLTRRTVFFDQQDIGGGRISWVNFKDAMSGNSVAVVNAHELAQGQDFRQFFSSEMQRRLDGAGSREVTRVLIIISGSMQLGPGKPMEIAAPAGDDFAVFYVRCDFPQAPFISQSPIFAGPVPARRSLELLDDGIGKALKKLKPRVFDVSSPERMREALASILAAISRL